MSEARSYFLDEEEEPSEVEAMEAIASSMKANKKARTCVEHFQHPHDILLLGL